MADQQEIQVQFALNKLYTRNISLEVPGAPEIYRDPALRDPNAMQAQVNLQQAVKEIEGGIFDCALTITLTAKVGEKVVYVAEVEQCGIFALQGFPTDAQHAFLNTYCPNTLFPYARQVISDLTGQAGFMPFVMQPINFDQLYAEQMRQRQDQGQMPAGNA
jgi:preprotein translocase subunit SecB